MISPFMWNRILDSVQQNTHPVIQGFIIGLGWLLILLAAIDLSATFSFEASRTQMIGVIMNSFFTFVLVVLYAMLVIETSRQSEIQKEQKRMMEFDSGSNLGFHFERWEAAGPVYRVTNNGPGIILNICAETRLDSDKHRVIAEPTEESPEENPGVLRAGESKEIILPFEVKHDGEYIPIREYHERLRVEGENSTPISFSVFAENGSGETSGSRFLNVVFGAGQDQPQDVFNRGITVRID